MIALIILNAFADNDHKNLHNLNRTIEAKINLSILPLIKNLTDFCALGAKTSLLQGP